MHLGIFGKGAFGSSIAQLATSQKHKIHFLDSRKPPVCFDELDVCIDVSDSNAVLYHIDLCIKAQKPLVIGTTGWDVYAGKQKVLAHEGSVLYSPNFSLGIALFTQLAKQAFALLDNDYDACGLEIHHAKKKDAPSGTARLLQSLTSKPLPFESKRSGSHPGKHSIIFRSADDEIVCSHEAFSKQGFCKGALKAAAWMLTQKGWFTFDEMVRSLYSSYHTV